MQIFPLFFAGASFGMALESMVGLLPFMHDATGAGPMPRILFAMCMACGLDVAITRTPFASTLILTALCGQFEVLVPCECVHRGGAWDGWGGVGRTGFS